MKNLFSFVFAVLFSHYGFATDGCGGVRTVTMIVPVGAGNSSDAAARIIANAVKAQSGITIVVENKPGGSGQIGGGAAKNAMGRGQKVLFFGQEPDLVLNPYMPTKQYGLEDFEAVSYVGAMPYMLICNKKKIGNINSVKDFCAHAKSKPDPMPQIAHGGTTNFTHLLLLELAEHCGVGVGNSQEDGIQPIPFKDTNAAMQNVMGGFADCMFQSVPPAKPLVQDGLTGEQPIKALGISGDKPLKVSSDAAVPPIGGKFDKMKNWVGVFGPPSQKDFNRCMAGHIERAKNDPDVRKRLSEIGFEMTAEDPSSPEAFSAHVKRRYGEMKARAEKIAAAAGGTAAGETTARPRR